MAAGDAAHARNEVQTITIGGEPTGGTFDLEFDGQTAAGIAYNADGAAVQTALRALSNIADTEVTVTGDAGGPWTVTFIGPKAATNVPRISGDVTDLTGADPAATIDVHTTYPGHPADTTSSGVEVQAGDPSEPQGPEDALGTGEKRGDYSERVGTETHSSGGVTQDAGPWGEHEDEPDKKGGVDTT